MHPIYFCVSVQTLALVEIARHGIRLQGSGHAAHLLSELNRRRLSRLQCDIVLQVGGRSFPAHRVVLACSCAHFNSLSPEVLATREPFPPLFLWTLCPPPISRRSWLLSTRVKFSQTWSMWVSCMSWRKGSVWGSWWKLAMPPFLTCRAPALETRLAKGIWKAIWCWPMPRLCPFARPLQHPVPRCLLQPLPLLYSISSFSRQERQVESLPLGHPVTKKWRLAGTFELQSTGCQQG